MQKPYDSEMFGRLFIELKLIVTQVFIAGETGIGNEAVSADIRRWKHAVEGKFYLLHEIL